MSLVHPLRAFPPKPHADSHEYGGDDLVTDLDRLLIRGTEVIDTSRNLKNIASASITGDVDIGGTVKPASLTLGSYVLDTLVANNKVPDSDKVDGRHATGFRFRLYKAGADNYRYPPDLRVDYDNNKVQAYDGASWLDIIGGGVGSVEQASKLVASGYTLDTLVANNKVPDSDKWDGTHRTDSQTIGGNITIGGDLQVNGNDIKDSGGTIRITLGSTTTVKAVLKVNNAIQPLYGSNLTGAYIVHNKYIGQFTYPATKTYSWDFSPARAFPDEYLAIFCTVREKYHDWLGDAVFETYDHDVIDYNTAQVRWYCGYSGTLYTRMQYVIFRG